VRRRVLILLALGVLGVEQLRLDLELLALQHPQFLLHVQLFALLLPKSHLNVQQFSLHD
jgi:hypothetical protein